MRKALTRALLGISLLGFSTGSVHAAAITYNVSEIGSSTEILGGNTGLIAAYNFKSSFVTTDLTLNLADDAVVFNSIYPGGSNGGFSTANLGGGADVNAFMNSSQYGGFSINLTGLTAGDDYRLQILGFAGNFVHYTNVNVDGQTFTNWAVDSSSSLTTADMLTATWTQDAGESSVLVQFSNNPQISGLVLHSVTAENASTVPLPAPLTLTLAGLLAIGTLKRGNRKRRGG